MEAAGTGGSRAQIGNPHTTCDPDEKVYHVSSFNRGSSLVYLFPESLVP